LCIKSCLAYGLFSHPNMTLLRLFKLLSLYPQVMRLGVSTQEHTQYIKLKIYCLQENEAYLYDACPNNS